MGSLKLMYRNSARYKLFGFYIKSQALRANGDQQFKTEKDIQFAII